MDDARKQEFSRKVREALRQKYSSMFHLGDIVILDYKLPFGRRQRSVEGVVHELNQTQVRVKPNEQTLLQKIFGNIDGLVDVPYDYIRGYDIQSP